MPVFNCLRVVSLRSLKVGPTAAGGPYLLICSSEV